MEDNLKLRSAAPIEWQNMDLLNNPLKRLSDRVTEYSENLYIFIYSNWNRILGNKIWKWNGSSLKMI